MKKILVLVALFALLLTGNAFAQPNENNDVEKFISSDVTEKDKEVMRDVIKHLSSDIEKENVIYISEDGTIYANKKHLKQLFQKSTKVEGTENVYQDASGERFTAFKPDSEILKSTITGMATIAGYTCSDAGGPYRRVHSNPGYTGGHANGASEADSGFQYSTTKNNWAHLIFTGGNYYHNVNFRFKAGQNMTFKFYMTKDNEIAMFARGIRYDTNVEDYYTVIAPAPGWKLSGTGNEIKRVTAIASSEPKPYNSGTYLNNVHWFNSMIGTSSVNNNAWLAADTGGYCSYPSANVSVTYVNAGEETVSLHMY